MTKEKISKKQLISAIMQTKETTRTKTMAKSKVETINIVASN